MTEYAGVADVGPDLALRPSRPPISEEFRERRDHRNTVAPHRGRAWTAWYVRRAVACDVVAAVLGTALLWAMARPVAGWTLVLVLLLGPVWPLLITGAKGYALRHIGRGSEEYRSVIRAGLQLFAGVAIAYFLTSANVDPGLVVPALVAVPVVSAVGRKALRRDHFRRRLEGDHLQRALIVGHWGSVEDLVASIHDDPVGTGLEVAAVCTVVPSGSGTSVLGDAPIHGPPTTALRAAIDHDVDIVAIVSHPDLVGHALRRLSWALEARGIDVIVSPGIVEVAGPRLSLRPVAGLSMLHVERPLTNLVAYRAKTLVERAISVVAVAALLPVALVLALLIKLDSPGPVFFRQWRIGAGGAMFRMVKFRTMAVDADARKASLTNGHDVNQVLFKLERDPRVTRVGRWLRRYSLDELPQLMNVIRGEMSLIGPRPPLPDEVQTYESDAYRRLRLLPGMTGWWQVNGRSDLSWEESLRLDLWYVDNWTLAVDLQIVIRTFRAVVQGKGAY